MNTAEKDPGGMMTRYLREWRGGDEEALARLTTQVYRELRRLAASVMRNEYRERTIQPTALVHELYFRLPEVQHFDWQNRAQFLNVAAKMMRNILVGHARKRQAARRGGGMMVAMSEPAGAEDAALSIDVLLVHEALEKLFSHYPRQARVVELRFFGGLSVDETSEILKLAGTESSARTVERDWTFARAWLEDEIGRR